MYQPEPTAAGTRVTEVWDVEQLSLTLQGRTQAQLDEHPLGDDEPELARPPWASARRRIAFGVRAGQKVRRVGAGFGDEGDNPTLSLSGGLQVKTLGVVKNVCCKPSVPSVCSAMGLCHQDACNNARSTAGGKSITTK